MTLDITNAHRVGKGLKSMATAVRPLVDRVCKSHLGHPDVASGRYQQAEFAADLRQVYQSEGFDE